VSPTLGFAYGVMVALRAAPGIFSCKDVAEALGVWCCHRVVCVAGLGFSRAKTFNDKSVGGNGGGVLGTSFSLLGASLWSSLPSSTGFSGVKTLPRLGE
jgi:hypothetical protein